MKNFLFSFLILFFLAVFLSALGFALYCITIPASSKAGEIIVEIPYGSSLNKISLMLEDKGVLHGRRRFQVLAKLKQAEHQIKWGQYRFTLPLTPIAILDKITRGEIIAYPVTIPEGSTIFQVAEIMEEADLGSAAAIVAKATDKSFVISLGIEGESLEGYLFPETYKFGRGVAPEIILKRMTGRFKKIFGEELRTRAAATELSAKEVIILAAMVEKESSHSFERPIVASVFLNRLKKRLRLECDPTVIYGVRLAEPDFEGRLRRRHLKKWTPYNTYRNFGLPPGPICSPGLESIKAVLYPAAHDFLYFVSKNDGTHQFSKSLKEHNRAVAKYQK